MGGRDEGREAGGEEGRKEGSRGMEMNLYLYIRASCGNFFLGISLRYVSLSCFSLPPIYIFLLYIFAGVATMGSGELIEIVGVMGVMGMMGVMGVMGVMSDRSDGSDGSDGRQE